ncbi:MAG TPA: POTRA domain-containing protein, partial [Caldimonas sp.]|nr:POTRA domain-containing protein [Caldimonas sp.]
MLWLAAALPARAADPVTFSIRAFAVEGNTVLAASLVDATVAPYAGPARTFADVHSAVAALQALYAQRGFGTVTVVLPEQQVSAGTVRLRVVEARLRRIGVKGPAGFDATRIGRILPSLRVAATPNTADLAREIRLANENPARRLSIELTSVAADEIDAVVTVVEDKPWKAGAVFDNTGTPSTGPTRIGAFVQYADVAGQDQVATLQYVTSPDRPSDVTIAAVNYRVPLPRLGDSVDLYGVYADVDSGVVGDLFDVRGSGTVTGLRYNQNLRPTASLQQRWTYGLEQRRTDN